jgi:ABC-type transport system involved in cytochrome c biogenesis permease subunit
MKKQLPLILTVLVLLWLGAGLRPPRVPEGINTKGFGQLPVLLNGRTQPMDSVARNSLLVLRGKQTVPVEGGKTLQAIDWFLEVVFKPDQADTRQVFRIDHPDLRGMLKLSPEEKFFSFTQFQTNLMDLGREAERIDTEKVKSESQNPFEKAVMRLHQNVILYRRIKNTLKHETTADFAAELKAYQAAVEPGVKAVRDREAGKEFDQKAFDTIVDHLQRYDQMARFGYALVVPSGSPNHTRDDWMNVGTSLMEAARGGKVLEPVLAYAEMASAYHAGEPARFNSSLSKYQQWLLDHQYQPEVAKGGNEHYFNHFEPFYKSSAIYVLAFILACASWFNQSEPFRRSALYLLILTALVHTSGLIYRMVLEGRPPVTNLYSSAVFIGWGICILGIAIEFFYRNAIGSVVASMGGFTTLIVAHNLSLGGDTMEMMRAVLDTNFWLATHVVVVTLGYSASFLAGFLAMLYVLRGVLTTSLTEQMATALSRMVYGIICFATLFSLVGTVLGGIWADQSWGRFWGWDPKENGALMIVIWNAVYLHARWGKICTEKSLMAIALFGNVITAFSWFGVNMLGIGLHSYGFMDAAFKWLLIFDISQLIFIGMALLPLSYWRSFSKRPPAAASGAHGKPAPVS